MLKKSLMKLSSRPILSYIKPQPFATVNLTLNDILVEGCELDGDRVLASFEMHGKEFTYHEMNAEAEKIAAALVSLGMQKGDALALWGPNQPEWLVTKWMAAKAGFRLVNINPLYTARELEYSLNKVKVKTLICPKEIGPLKYNDILKTIIPEHEKQDRYNLDIPSIPSLRNIIHYSTTSKDALAEYIKWDELYDMAQTTDVNVLNSIKVAADDIGNIQFTSGTTGMPKAAALSHHNIVNNSLSFIQHMNTVQENFNSSTVVCNALPLYHAFGFVVGSVSPAIIGAPVTYPSPGFNAEAAVQAIEKRGATHLIGTPTMFSDILYCPTRSNHDISSLLYAMVGGASASPSLVKTAQEELGAQMAVGYGMTENTCATFSTYIGSDPEVTCYSVGYPLPGIEGKVIDAETEETLEEGNIGELCTRGFTVFQGYVDDEEKTKESFTKDGWWKTGDLAVVKNGVTSITGRSKDMIIRGGENIQPTEIEHYIGTMAQVQDCYVIGVPSARLGEEIAAYIKLKAGEECTLEDIRTYCTLGLARFKIPQYIRFTDSFPQTVTGKIKKFELKERAFEDWPQLKKEM